MAERAAQLGQEQPRQNIGINTLSVPSFVAIATKCPPTGAYDAMGGRAG